MIDRDLIGGVFADWRAGHTARIVARFAPDATWHFSAATKPPAIGHDAIRAVLAAYGQMSAVSDLYLLRQAQSAESVFFEAVEAFTTPEGRDVVVPYCGVVTVRDGLVTDWRDYFDRALIDAQIQGVGVLPSYAIPLTRLPGLS